MRKLFITLVILFSMVLVTSCKGEKEMKVVIELQDGREIKIELYEEVAPITVKNFLKLVDQNYYENVIFHRVIKDFMIQAGGYVIKDGSLGESKRVDSIKGEFSSNGVENNLKHTPGVISMARSNSYDSAGSQFFICTGDCSHLDAKYAGFGKVTSGLDVAYEIAKQGSSYNSTPSKKIIIESITVDEKGGRYSVVEKLDEK